MYVSCVLCNCNMAVKYPDDRGALAWQSCSPDLRKRVCLVETPTNVMVFILFFTKTFKL